jgi:hypothetical protein
MLWAMEDLLSYFLNLHLERTIFQGIYPHRRTFYFWEIPGTKIDHHQEHDDDQLGHSKTKHSDPH